MSPRRTPFVLRAALIIGLAGAISAPAQTVRIEGSAAGYGMSCAAYRPLTRPVFLYVSVKALDRPDVSKFAEFYVHNAARFAKEQSYLPMPPGLYSRALSNLRSRATGSVWEGSVPVGLTLEALQKKYGAQ